MTIKRIFGYLLMVLAIILAMAIIGQIAQDLKALFSFPSGAYDAYETSYTITTWVFRIFFILLIIFLWKQGRKWSKKFEN